MYLPLAAVLVSLVVAVEFGAKRYGRRRRAWPLIGLGLLAFPLGLAAAWRNRVYRSAGILLADTRQKLPSNAFNRYNYAQWLRESGDLATAAAEYQATVRLDPGAYQAFSHLGDVWRELDRPADAEAAYRQALRINPNSEQARYQLGLILLRAGRKAEAAEQFNAAVLLDPQDANARAQLAELR